MRIIAAVLMVLMTAGPTLSAVPDLQPQPARAYDLVPKLPDFLLRGTYKLRATDQVTSPNRVRTITYYGSAVGLDLSAHGMHKNLLLTAAHNVMDEDDGHYYEKVDVEVIVQDKASKARARVWSPLTVVWADAVIDLALVRADVDLPFVSVLATDDATENGELLAAVGHPGGGGLTVTFGYMVSKEVEMRIQEPWWYQASFTIYYGNSGGAVYDVYREQVIGIVVAGYGQGDLLAGNMGFFVSLPRIKSFLDTKGLRGKLDSMMPSKEGEHERAPEEGPGVPQGIPTDGQK